jgi:hypothetical protein
MSMMTIERKLKELGGLHPPLYPEGSPFGPLSEEEVKELEQAVGGELPTDYREFLLKFGRSRFDAIVRKPESNFYCINFFYGKGSATDDIGDIRKAVRAYEGRMPKTLIPIAYCDDGEIVLGISGAQRGKVYFWDRWKEWDWQQQDRLAAGQSLTKEEEFQNVREIGSSFEDFVLGLEADN